MQPGFHRGCVVLDLRGESGLLVRRFTWAYENSSRLRPDLDLMDMIGRPIADYNKAMRAIGVVLSIFLGASASWAEGVRMQPKAFEFELRVTCDRPAAVMGELWPRIAALCAAEVPRGGTTYCQSGQGTEFAGVRFVSHKCSLIAGDTDKFCVEKITVKEAAGEPVLCVEPIGVTFEKYSDSAFEREDQELSLKLDEKIRKMGCERSGEVKNQVTAPRNQRLAPNGKYQRRYFLPSTNCFLARGSACGSARYESVPFAIDGVSGERTLCRLKGQNAKAPSASDRQGSQKNRSSR